MEDATAHGEKSYNFLADVSMLLPLYVVYIFLSGWAFDDYYFRSFGLDPKFLDVSFHDTLVKGFTIVFAGVWRLWGCYLALLLIPPLLNVSSTRPWAKVVCMGALFLALLPFIYLISRSAGERKAAVDKGPRSTLPGVTFVLAKHPFIGKLLYVKGDSYFIHRVRPVGEELGGEFQLSTFKTSEIEDIKIAERP